MEQVILLIITLHVLHRANDRPVSRAIAEFALIVRCANLYTEKCPEEENLQHI
jgi:hypothetical protein